MSDRRYFRNSHANFNNAQPVQQQLYSNTHQTPMPYNEYYHPQQLSNQLGNNVYSRPMSGYGNGTMNGPTTGSFSHRFNPDAPTFQPGVRYAQPQEPQTISTSPMSNYSAHYSSYMTGTQSMPTQQPALQAQQQHAALVQQQMRSYPQMQSYEASNGSQYSAISQMFANGQYNQIAQQQQQSMSTPYSTAPKYQTASQSPQPYMNQEQLSIYAQNDGLQATANDLSPAQYSQFPISAELTQTIQSSSNRMAIVEVQIGLEQLATEPHEYELWANAIKGRIASGLTKDDYELVAWMIVEMSFMGANAQYPFARLCKLLDSDINAFTCQYVVPRITQFMDDGVANLERDHLSNFVVFLAELYDKTEKNGVRVSRLGTYMMNQIRVLLDSEELTDQIVKSVVQVIKLTGRHVEDDQDPVHLNQVFQRLNELMENSRTISESVKHNIRQLNQLREKQWGVTKNDDLLNGSLQGSIYNASTTSDMIMYGPDGEPLSEEERKFLEENCRDLEVNYGNAGGMDDEIAKDYEDFLREQAEATAISAAEKALEKLSVDEEDLGNSMAYYKNA